MEAFSLLKYWRNSAGAGSGGGPDGSASSLSNGAARTSSNSTTTIVTAVSSLASESDDDGGNDDGPFFDLEFAVPDEEEEAVQHSKTEETDEDGEDADSDESDGEDENALKFTLSSGSSGDCMDPNVSESPSGELFFKGRLVPIEHSATDLNGLENNSKLHFPVSLVKSARVMMLKMKKSKSNVSEPLKNDKIEKLGPEKEGKEQSKFFTVKFKANELPIVSSLFVRDNSSKNSTNSKPEKENAEEPAAAAVSDEKKFSKETVQRYLSGTVKNIQKVKPLYIRVSKRYGEKLKFSGQLSMSGAAAKDGGVAPPCTAEKKTSPEVMNEKESATVEAKDAAAGSNAKSCQRQCSLPAGLRVVYKHLGKSRSASSAAVAAAPPRAESSKRRDDSLLQQQDGIQSAILHCKRSFKASRDLECSIMEQSATSGDKETCR